MTNYKRQPAYKVGENGKPKKVSPYDDAQRVLNKGYQCAELETKHFETERREFIYKLAISQGAVMSNIDNAVMAKDNKVEQTKQTKGDE